ncbi:hypothetical protein ACS0PU_002242 [Formica fusca]
MKRRSVNFWQRSLLSPHLPQSVFHNEHVQRAQTRFLSYEGVYRAFVREAFSVTFNSADGLLRSFDSTKHPRFRNAFETAAFPFGTAKTSTRRSLTRALPDSDLFRFASSGFS